MSEKVSIIITCYNYAHYLDACLKSVFRQSYRNLDVILVDDGSTDNTQQIASKYASKINYIYQDNQGLSAARNTGINHIKGNYVVFLDADDLLHWRSIAQRVRFLGNNSDVDIAVCKNICFEKYIYGSRSVPNWILPSDNIDVHLMHFNIAPIHAYLLSTKCIYKVGGFDTSLKACEDYDYWIKLLCSSCKFGISKGLVYYRKHTQSMSRNYQRQWYHDLLLHNKVFYLFISKMTKTKNNSHAYIDHIMAFLAGCCVTLSRVVTTDIDQITKLKNNMIELFYLINIEKSMAFCSESSKRYFRLIKNIDLKGFNGNGFSEFINIVKASSL